ARLRRPRREEGALAHGGGLDGFGLGRRRLAVEGDDGGGLRRGRGYGAECLADIRTVPRSRHNPQFNADALATALKAGGIEYVALSGLGGLRHPRKDSPNTGWRNESFRGYADYMQTEGFARALDALIEKSRRTRVAIMCAEA